VSISNQVGISSLSAAAAPVHSSTNATNVTILKNRDRHAGNLTAEPPVLNISTTSSGFSENESGPG
jgi:hypothetical protein